MLLRGRERIREAIAGPLGVIVPLLVLLPLVLSASVLGRFTDVLGGTAVQKALVVAGTLIAAIIVGFRLPPFPVWAMMIAIGAGYVVGMLTGARNLDGFDTEMLLGAAGYVYPWLVFFVDWRWIERRWRATAIAVIPLLTVAIVLVVNITGVFQLPLFREEYTGVERLAFGMPPAFLAGLCFVGVAGAAWLWSLRAWAGIYLMLINVALCALTGTRGATLAAACIVGVTVIVAVIARFRQWIVGMVVSAVAGVAGFVYLLPTLLERTEDSADTSLLGGSGRAHAWEYFFIRLEGRELTGFGPGSGPLLASQAQSSVVRNYFISPHNVYVSFVIDIGVPLALAFGASFVVLAMWAAGRLKWPQGVIVGMTTVAFLAYGIVDNLLNVAQTAVMVAMFLAMVWEGSRPSRPPNAGAEEGSEVRTPATEPVLVETRALMTRRERREYEASAQERGS